MQRTMSSSRAPDEYCIVDIKQQPQGKHSPPKKKEDINGGLPVRNPRSNGRGRLESAQLRSAEKWVHVVPVIVLLCVFVLWWFSYPVNLVIKDGRIIAIHRIEIPPLSLNNTNVDLTVLALAIPPNASVSQNLTWYNESEAHPVSKTD